MDSALNGFTSALPALSVLVGFLVVIFGISDATATLVQSGWGLITVGVITEFIMPISRRLR